MKVSSLGSTTTEEFEGEGGTIGSVTTDSDARQSNEKSGKVKTFRLVLNSFLLEFLIKTNQNTLFGHYMLHLKWISISSLKKFRLESHF